MKRIEEYTREELIALYKRMNVYSTTWWFKHYKMYNKYYKEYLERSKMENAPFILKEFDEWKELNPNSNLVEWADEYGQLFYQIRMSTIDSKIGELRNKDEGDKIDREIKKLSYEREALRIASQCLFWFAGVYDKYVNDFQFFTNREERMSPEEFESDLHLNDSINVNNGLATDIQVYEFVWETLQYLSINQLSKLLSFAEKGVINKWNIITTKAGRKSRKCEIKQIDIEIGEVVGTFNTRKELIDEIGISKSHLAQCIKTAKENPGNRNEWKKWKDKNGKLYGFVEVQ